MALRDRAPAEALSGPPASAFTRSLEPVPPVALVLGGVASIQCGAAIATTLFDNLGPAGTVFLRLGFAALVLLAVWRPSLRPFTRAQVRVAGIFGLALAAMNFTFYEALDRIPLGIAVTFEMVGPLTVAVIGSRKGRDAVWIALAAAGVVLLANGSVDDTLGVVLALTAGVFWGIYILLNAHMGKIFPGGGGLAIGMTVGAVAVMPVGIGQGGADLLDPRLLLVGAAVALLSSVIPYTLEVEALRRLPTNVFGVLMSLEPALAAVFGFLIIGQSLSGREVVAILLVVAASAGVSFDARGEPPPMDA